MRAFTSSCLLVLLTVPLLFVQANSIDTSPYKGVMLVPAVTVPVPTVVSLPLPGERLERPTFLVVEDKTNTVTAALYQETYTVLPTPLTLTLPDVASNPEMLTDANPATAVRFELLPETDNKATIIVSTDTPITASGFTIALTQNVALPISAEVVSVADNGESNILLAASRLPGERVRFVPTTARQFVITLRYVQPLQISEFAMIQDNPERSVVRSLLFLAQPNSSYRVYQNPDRPVSGPNVEAGNLSAGEVRPLAAVPLVPNQTFVPADTDNDTISDTVDNCVTVANLDQEDIDTNGRGDVCDDWDRDSVINQLDNCVDLPNQIQSDEDGDGIGDACDQTDSRITEQYQWVPWVGMGVAAIVVLSLFVIVARRPTAMPIEKEIGTE